MQGVSWVALLRRIPAALQDKIVVVTTTATEIHLQNIIRLERDYLVGRGRLAGSQETGRILFVPYDQINYAGLTKVLTEAETQALLGKPGMTVQLVENGEAVEDALPAEDVFETSAFEESAPPPEEAPPPQEPAKPQPKPVHPSKSVLLARLRARLGSDGPKPADE